MMLIGFFPEILKKKPQSRKILSRHQSGDWTPRLFLFRRAFARVDRATVQIVRPFANQDPNALIWKV
jgi:hypothetical protein